MYLYSLIQYILKMNTEDEITNKNVVWNHNIIVIYTAWPKCLKVVSFI